MFKSKSFQLVTEEESRKRERLYDPKRIRWMKYIVVPALIVFALLLILCNVDFTGNAYLPPTLSTETTETTPAVKPTTTQEVQTTSTSPIPAMVDGTAPDVSVEALNGSKPSMFLGALWEPAALANAFKCTEKNNCATVVCSGGQVDDLANKLEDMDEWCGKAFNLLMENCSFPNGRLDNKMFNGRFTLKNITIDDCGLELIDDDALKQGSLYQVQNLVFIKSLFTKLNEKTFVGLKKLELLEMSNQQRLTPLDALNFLKPVATTLKSFILKQEQSTTSTVYDPADWLGGLKLVKLTHVDLSGNNFGDTLTSATFVNLAAVKELNLASSGITSIAEGTFDAILGTLTFLDLSENSLKTLDENFLEKAALKGLRLELYGNAWNCDCESESFVEAITSAEFHFSEEPKCETPDEWKGVDIREVKLECGLQITTTPSTTTTTVTSTTTFTTTTKDIDTETPTTEDLPTETTLSTNMTTLNTTTNGTTSSSSTSEWSETDETNETDSTDNSDTVESSDTTDNGSSSTTSIISTTSTSSPSTPSPPICSNGAEPGYVWCLCGEKVRWTICDSDAGFSVKPTSPTSVRLIIQNDMDDLNVIHFTRSNLTDSVASVRIGNTTRNAETTTVVDIAGLATNESHVFCLVPDNWRTISPFNCRSQFLDVQRAWPQAWLHKSDMALYVPLATVGVLVCVVLGLVAIYWLLRWRPSWLRGNERVRRLDSTSHQVLLFSQPDRASVDQKQYALSELANMRASVTDNLTPENYFNIRSYDYMQYYKNSELFKHRKLSHASSALPPVERAPALPPHPSSSGNNSRPVSLQPTVRAEDICFGDIAINRSSQNSREYGDNDYESLEYYQEIYA